MTRIWEGRYFGVICKECGAYKNSLHTDGGLEEDFASWLKSQGWVEVDDDWLCPECARRMRNDPQMP